VKNGLQLITYVDRLSDGGLRAFAKLLDGRLQDLFGGIHLLSFFHPNDGADALHRSHGSCPRLGDWNDLRAIGTRFELTADVIVNQVSRESAQFQSFSKCGADFPYSGMFLTFDKVFPSGALWQDLPERFRHPSTCWRRLLDWEERGRLAKHLARVSEPVDCREWYPQEARVADVVDADYSELVWNPNPESIERVHQVCCGHVVRTNTTFHATRVNNLLYKRGIGRIPLEEQGRIGTDSMSEEGITIACLAMPDGFSRIGPIHEADSSATERQ
jgi:hypothetical protein